MTSGGHPAPCTTAESRETHRQLRDKTNSRLTEKDDTEIATDTLHPGEKDNTPGTAGKPSGGQGAEVPIRSSQLGTNTQIHTDANSGKHQNLQPHTPSQEFCCGHYASTMAAPTGQAARPVFVPAFALPSSLPPGRVQGPKVSPRLRAEAFQMHGACW